MHSDGEDRCFQALLDPIPTANLSISESAVGADSAFCLYPSKIAQRRLQLAFRFSMEHGKHAHVGLRIHGYNLVCSPVLGLSVYSAIMGTGGGWDLHMCKAAYIPAVVGQGCQYRCQCASACVRILASINNVNQKMKWQMCNFTFSTYWLRLRTTADFPWGRFMGPSGADRAQVGPMLAPWTMLSRLIAIFIQQLWFWNIHKINWYNDKSQKRQTWYIYIII